MTARRHPALSAIAGLTLAIAASGSVPATADATQTGAAQPAAPEAHTAPFRLTRVNALSRWTPVIRRTFVRRRPSRRAAVVTRLGTRTPENTAELVLALERVQVDGRLWVRVRLPILPNNSTGWVPRSALGEYHEVRTHLVIDRARHRLRLERSGRTVFKARIGVGLPHWPTPRGRFYVRSRLHGFQDPVYGPMAFGLSARSRVLTDWPGGGFIGIHGTDAPGLLPGRVSHGCVRLRNGDIVRLARRLPVGTPVTIR